MVKDRVATLGGVRIADKASRFDSGAALQLQQECEIDHVVRINSDWVVEVRSESPYVVARGKGATSALTAFTSAYEAAQKGLDILSIYGLIDLSVRSAVDNSFIWWREDGIQVLRMRGGLEYPVDRETLLMLLPPEVRSNLEKMLTTLGSQATPQVPTYHESMRYYRLSQVTDDLFDAYRNRWLSFELLLSSQVAKEGREIDWLRSALTQAHENLDLTQGFQTTRPDVVEDIIDELYIGARLPLFHATADRTVYVPHSLRDREKVSEALSKLTRLLLFLARRWLNVRRPVSGMYYSYFDELVKSNMSNSEILATDNEDAFNYTHNTRTDAGLESAAALNTTHAPELSEPGRQVAVGTIAAADLHRLRKIAGFVLTHGNVLLSGHPPEAELTVESIDRFEVEVGVQLVNTQEPKYYFNA